MSDLTIEQLERLSVTHYDFGMRSLAKQCLIATSKLQDAERVAEVLDSWLHDAERGYLITCDYIDSAYEHVRKEAH